MALILLSKKLLIIPPIAVGVAVLMYVASNKPAPVRNPPSEQVRQVRIISAVTTNVVPRILGYGSVKPEKVWSAVAEVSGTVIGVHPDFKKGAILRAGTEIVTISPADYELAITQAEANISAIDAQLEELKVSELNTRESLEIEQRALEVNEGELARKRALFKRSAVSQASVDQEQRNTLAQRRKVQDMTNSLRLIAPRRSLLREERAVTEAKLAEAKLDLERTRIRLPFDARIAEQNIEQSQFAQAGQVLGTADSMGTAEIDAQMPLSRFRAILGQRQGDQLSLTPRSFQEMSSRFGFEPIVRLRLADRNVEWRARFSRMSDTIDPDTRTVGLIASVDDNYRQAVPGERPPLVKGMFVEVELRANPLENVITVPRSALHGNRVYLASNEDRLEVRNVTTGLIQGNLAVIESGLTAGDRVIVSDVSPAIEGMALNAVVDKQIAMQLKRDAGTEESVK